VLIFPRGFSPPCGVWIPHRLSEPCQSFPGASLPLATWAFCASPPPPPHPAPGKKAVCKRCSESDVAGAHRRLCRERRTNFWHLLSVHASYAPGVWCRAAAFVVLSPLLLLLLRLPVLPFPHLLQPPKTTKVVPTQLGGHCAREEGRAGGWVQQRRRRKSTKKAVWEWPPACAKPQKSSTASELPIMFLLHLLFIVAGLLRLLARTSYLQAQRPANTFYLRRNIGWMGYQGAQQAR
jgi:hypothetical protein